MQDNDLLPHLLSAYRRRHLTETELFIACPSNIYWYATADRQDVTLLGLLDLSATTFHCVDHEILISRSAYVVQHSPE